MEMRIMYGCPKCLQIIAPHVSSCLCGHIGHHSIKDAVIVRSHEDDENETIMPSSKVGEVLDYWVGYLQLTGKIQTIKFRDKPFIGSEYLYSIRVVKSNDPSVKVGSLFTDDEIYFEIYSL